MRHTKRAYADPDPDDGTRMLVDRLWPRGVSKDGAHLDDWMRTVAPSDELREGFDHDTDKWAAFQHRYRNELERKDECIDELLGRARSGTLSLLYAASDRKHKNAAVLRDFIRDRLDEDR